MTRSALYRGHLAHARTDTHRRRFRYPIYVACLDLDELPALHRDLRLFSHNRRNLFSLFDRDHAGAAVDGLAATHRARLAARGLPVPARTELVTQLRTADFVFNPVSFFLGYDAAGRLETVVADVSNNYGGHHAYLLGAPDRLPSPPDRDGFGTAKAFFVSPFIHGDAGYQFWFHGARPEAPRLDVRMEVARPGGDRFFAARLTGARVPLTDRALAAAAIRYPLMSVQVIALIYGEALVSHLRGVPFRRPGPDHRP